MLARVVAVGVVPRSAAKSPGTFAVRWRLGHLEGEPAVAHDLRADLGSAFPQARQRAVLDWLRCCERAQEIAEIVGERMKLEPHRIGRKRPACAAHDDGTA
jgi:hypothetical protein